MVIEFSVTNFRSIKTKNTLSLVANNQLSDLPENVFPASAPGLKDTRLLNGAAIYGANASGKSNVLKAIAFMQEFILESATARKPGESIRTVPFKLDGVSEGLPTTFEIVFIAQGVRHEYGFSLDNRRVHDEWIRAYPKGVPQNWYRRKLKSTESNDYVWNVSPTNFDDDKDLRAKTRPDTLFLSVAAQFNHTQLSPIYNWFRENLQVLLLTPSKASSLARLASNMLAKDPMLAEAFGAILRWADLGINGVRVESRSSVESKLPAATQEVLREFAREYESGTRFPDTLFLHSRSDVEIDVAFRLEEESAGTQRLFALLAAWIPALATGTCLFVDELGSSMHPLMTRRLVALFGSRGISDSGAQIVFTTHDTTLLDKSVLRRDQIWFTEKDDAGATTLYSLNDYRPRKDEALGRGYLAGRYGAIPFLSSDLKAWK